MAATIALDLSDEPDARRGKVVIASTDDRLTSAALALASRHRLEAVVAADATAALHAAKQHLPQCIWLDGSLRGLDPTRMIRILARYAPTQFTVPLVVAPETISPLRLQQMQDVAPVGVIERPLIGKAVSSYFAAALMRAGELRAAHPAPQKKVSPTRRVRSNSSLLARQVACPFHDEPVPFDRYLLRTGKILTDISFFDLPVYKTPVAGADFVNFHLLNVAVCPRCLFATNNPGYLIDPGAEAHAHSPATRSAVINATAERQAMASTLQPQFFTERRGAVEAITAYRLAIACGQTLFQCNRHSLEVELLRLGNYHLRLAHLFELENDAAQQQAEAAKALEWLKQAFTVLEGPALFKAAYQTIALSISFGEDKGAYPYLVALQNLKNEPGLSRADLGSLERYIARARTAWEDREDRRFAGIANKAA